MPTLSIQPEAEKDVERITEWLERERHGLGIRFISTLSDCHADLVANPYRYAIAFDDFRQAWLRKFRYIVYYRFFDDEVIIYRVVHASRDQRAVWRSLGEHDES